MTHSVIDNTVLLKTFEVVAEARSLTLREILEALGRDQEDKTEIYEQLKQLMDDGLVREEKAAIEDYNIYYVTADGLLFHRKLRRSGLLETSE